ncbi:MAG: hypothetical protein WBP42_03640 [Candidatus Zixiibacteriota bacterium]
MSGNAFNYTETSQTTYHGGGSYEKKWAHFQAKFYDASSGNKIWLASAKSKGAGFWESDEMLIDSFANEMVLKLYQDKVLAKKLRQ